MSFLHIENVDYVPQQVMVTFTSGSGPGTTMTVTVPITDDSENEQTESFNGGLSVTNVQNIVLSPGSIIIDIIDNDGPGKCCAQSIMTIFNKMNTTFLCESNLIYSHNVLVFKMLSTQQEIL